MVKKNTNYLQLVLDLRRGHWLIQDAGAFLPAVNSFFDRLPLGTELADYETDRFRLTEDGDPEEDKDPERHESAVAVIPIHTALTKYDTCDTYGTTTIAARMLEYLADPKVVGFVLDFDSPGGSVSAIAPLTSAIAKIRAAGKPVVVHYDSCYSAAYWIASQCDAIFADNYLSGCGSIGAYAQILDDREDKMTGHKVITVYAPESTDKNLAVREALDGKPERLAGELSEIVQAFHKAVKEGRKRLKADAEGVLSGGTFHATEAIRLGLADGIGDIDECIRTVFIRAEFN